VVVDEEPPEPNPDPSRHLNFKSKLCKRFGQEGACVYGATCGFAHGLLFL